MEETMKKATDIEINCFKRNFCKNESNRISIINHYDVTVETFEELLPGKHISSYATGNRDIEGAFVMFRVVDVQNETEFYPVFSETVARKMINSWGMSMPNKRSIFSEINNGTSKGEICYNSGTQHVDVDNVKLRRLILLVRSLMILHIESPNPMNGPLKEIYEDLDKFPERKIKKHYVKSVNTILKKALENGFNSNNEKFKDLNGYIEFLKNHHCTNKRLKNFDFESLRKIMRKSYPDEDVYF